MLARSLLAEAVEFSVPDASEKGMPFVRCESENQPCGVPAVAHADPAIGQTRHLDAVTVGETQGALNPVRTRLFGRTSERGSFHVTTSLIDVYERQCSTTKSSLTLTYRSRQHSGGQTSLASRISFASNNTEAKEMIVVPRCNVHLKRAAWLHSLARICAVDPRSAVDRGDPSTLGLNHEAPIRRDKRTIFRLAAPVRDARHVVIPTRLLLLDPVLSCDRCFRNGHTGRSSPRRRGTTSVIYALARCRAPDQCDSAVSSMSALDAAGSSEAAASI